MGNSIGRALLLAPSLLWLLGSPLSASAQEIKTEPAATPWCTLPLCKDAEGLRRQGDLQGALKLYRYIQEEVDVDASVVQKPLIWFVIAALCEQLQQPQLGIEALQKYQQFIATRPDSTLPLGQRREDVERLQQSLSIARLRLAGAAEVEPPPAGLEPDVRLVPGDPKTKLTPTPTPMAETERHIAAGLVLYKQGLRHSAREEFEQAYVRSKQPELLYVIAQLLLGRGLPREAAEYYQRYLDAAPQGPSHAAAAEALLRIQHELSLEAAAAQTGVGQGLAGAPETRRLRLAGIALLAVGGGVLLTGSGLGIGAVVTARDIAAAERYDPGLDRFGLGLQNAGITLDVLGGISVGIGAACLGVARRREAEPSRRPRSASYSPRPTSLGSPWASGLAAEHTTGLARAMDRGAEAEGAAPSVH